MHRGCRFVMPYGFTTIRERVLMRSCKQLMRLWKYRFEEIGLLSLSSSDYTHITELVKAVTEKYCGKHLGSLFLPWGLIPSQWTWWICLKIPAWCFTLAPEAATEHMRNLINKPVSTQQLIDTARRYIHVAGPLLNFTLWLVTRRNIGGCKSNCRVMQSSPGRRTQGYCHRAKLMLESPRLSETSHPFNGYLWFCWANTGKTRST